jgi:hypothetical protein
VLAENGYARSDKEYSWDQVFEKAQGWIEGYWSSLPSFYGEFKSVSQVDEQGDCQLSAMVSSNELTQTIYVL